MQRYPLMVRHSSPHAPAERCAHHLVALRPQPKKIGGCPTLAVTLLPLRKYARARFYLLAPLTAAAHSTRRLLPLIRIDRRAKAVRRPHEMERLDRALCQNAAEGVTFSRTKTKRFKINPLGICVLERLLLPSRQQDNCSSRIVKNDSSRDFQAEWIILINYIFLHQHVWYLVVPL